MKKDQRRKPRRFRTVLSVTAALLLAVFFSSPASVNAQGISYPKSADSSAVKWTQTIDPVTSDYTDNPTEAVLIGGKLYIAGGGNLYQIDPATGTIENAVSGVHNGMNVTLGTNGTDTLYVQDSGYDSSWNPCYNSVSAYRASDLTRLWQITADAAGWSGYGSSPLTVTNEAVFGDNSGEANNLFALDPSTGSLLWSNTLTGGVSNSAPAVVGNYVIYGGNDCSLHSYAWKTSPDAGETAAISAGVPIYSSIVYSNGSLYYLTQNGSLHKTGFDSSTGTFTGDKSVFIPGVSRSTSTPTLLNGKIYVGGQNASGDGIIAVFDTDLNVLGSTTVPSSGKTYDIKAVTDPQDASNTLLYSAYYGSSNPDYSIKDTGSAVAASEKNGQITAPVTFGSILPGDMTQFSDAQITLGTDGSVYYSNDSGKLAKIVSTAKSAEDKPNSGDNTGKDTGKDTGKNAGTNTDSGKNSGSDSSNTKNQNSGNSSSGSKSSSTATVTNASTPNTGDSSESMTVYLLSGACAAALLTLSLIARKRENEL